MTEYDWGTVHALSTHPDGTGVRIEPGRLTVLSTPVQLAPDPGRIPPDPAGCPQCDDFPTWPAQHCGRPACRDAQALAWARVTGQDAAAVLAGLDGASDAEGSRCASCRRAQTCTLGLELLASADALGARLTSCRSWEPG